MNLFNINTIKCSGTEINWDSSSVELTSVWMKFRYTEQRTLNLCCIYLINEKCIQEQRKMCSQSPFFHKIHLRINIYNCTVKTNEAPSWGKKKTIVMYSIGYGEHITNTLGFKWMNSSDSHPHHLGRCVACIYLFARISTARFLLFTENAVLYVVAIAISTVECMLSYLFHSVLAVTAMSVIVLILSFWTIQYIIVFFKCN